LIIFIAIGICVLLIWIESVQSRRSNQIHDAAQALKKTVRTEAGSHRSPYSSRRDFLDYMGQFFKYKKHEWIFIAFMKGGLVDLFWLNKGPDADEVGLFIGIQDAIGICTRNGYDGILVGHNHPSGVLAPSKADRAFLEEFMDSLAQTGISVEHLVFVAGQWRNYGLSIGQHLRRLSSRMDF